MARNIRWYISFKSQNGTTCRVNIYDNDWPEGVTLGLRGAADPFFYEENNSDDLLNDVIRYRTGYIRVIEQTYGQLDAIYPSSTFDRYVEFLYGGTVVFNGYIQVQDFSRTLEYLGEDTNEPCPHVVEFPVISPLGLFDKRTFSPITPPTTKTLGQLLDLALNGSTYTKVTLPDITGVGLWMTVSSLVVSPWNEDYHHSMTTAALSKVMKPESRAYLIEAICKAFGWICHDTPTALVFTMFDHQGTYCYYPVGHIGDLNYKQTESIGTSTLSVGDYFEMADDGATMNTLLPDTGIAINYEGDMGSVKFSFDRTLYSGVEMLNDDDPREIVSICNLYPIADLYENTASIYHAFDNDGFVTGAGAGTVAWNGNEGILVTGFGSAQNNWELFKLRLYFRHLLELSWVYDFGYMSSPSGAIASLAEDTDNKYAHLSVSFSEQDNYVEMTFYYVFDGNPLSDHYLMFIHDIKFTVVDVNGKPYAEYKYAPAKSADLLPSSIDNPPESSSITMPISMYRLNDMMIGSTLRTTKLTEYPYLFQRRLELKGDFRWAAATPDLFHARMWSYMSKKWRMIALNFHPWDDEYALTLQNSGVLDGTTTYTVSVSGDNVSSVAPPTVTAGESLEVTLTPSTNYDITSVVVLMGGEDVTSSSWSSANSKVNISSVTGNVAITVVTTKLYDAEVEYLLSDGNAYIDTGIKGANTIKIEAAITTLAGFNGTTAIFGSRVANNNTQITLQFYLDQVGSGSNYWRWGYGNGYKTVNHNKTNGSFNLSNQSAARTMEITGDHNLTASCTAATFSNNLDIFLFGMNNGGTLAGNGNTAFLCIKSFKIYNMTELLRDYVPVRYNSVGYLYDKVSGQLFGNANDTGSFTYGNDVTT